ncbi:MAG: hypothetical protein ABL877_10985 [Thiobacillus sp.]
MKQQTVDELMGFAKGLYGLNPGYKAPKPHRSTSPATVRRAASPSVIYVDRSGVATVGRGAQ